MFCFELIKGGEGDWSKVDAFAVAVGVDEDTVYSKSTAIQVNITVAIVSRIQ